MMEIAGQDTELPEIRLRTKVFAVIVSIGLLGVVSRLFYLQILHGDTFHRLTSDSVVRTLPLPATRGELRDRHGRVLATTRPSFNVVVTPIQLTAGGYAHLQRLLGSDYVLPTPERLADVARKDRARRITVAEDVTAEQMSAIATSMDLTGVTVDPEPRRRYPYGKTLAHALGYLNEITPEELHARKDEGYHANDLVGRTGLERQWESYLRGQSGYEKAVVDRRGIPLPGVRVADLVDGPVRQDPVPGHNVVLTIDLDVQQAAERALAGKNAAAAVIVEARTGRVLALASVPSFDPNLMTGRFSADEQSRLLRDPYRPFRDKTVADVYNPGSTFKVVSAAAGLEQHQLTLDDHVTCHGSIEVGGRTFRCTHQHGVVNLTAAIIQSCNIFFYELGGKPGMMNKLARYATELGLGTPTGIGLNEASGFVPTEEWHRAQEKAAGGGQTFSIGHALNTAIGEGSTRVTVLQMALLYATIANGGTLFVPQLVERVETAAGQVIEEFPPRPRRKVDIAPETLAYLRSALTGVVNDPRGTAWRARSRIVAVAGKTGTALAAGSMLHRKREEGAPIESSNHAWFAGFAPAEDPQVAFAVIVEHGGFGGEVAAPAAVQVVESALAPSRPPDEGARDGGRD